MSGANSHKSRDPITSAMRSANPPDSERAFFGRSRGKALRPGQAQQIAEALPLMRLPEAGPITSLHDMFAHPVREVRLEIGFGGGEHLLHAMRLEPDVGFIGCEPFVNGMAKFLATTAREGLGNFRLWDQDAARLLPRLPAQSLARVDLFYPDPWPKRRQRKRRFISARTLGMIARVLPSGAPFRFASDIDDYVGWTLARVLAGSDFTWSPREADDWRLPYPNWVRTRYEAKAVAAERVPSYLTFTRAAAPAP
jgi:tRNA (guanine-N7-)-methyltransferase